MRNRKGIRVLATIIALQIALSLLPSAVFADDASFAQDAGVQLTENTMQEQSDAAPDAPASQNENEAAPYDAPAHISTEQNVETDQAASANVEVHAVSGTSNIVGDVFVNMFEHIDDPENIAMREASLEAYPVEAHDLSYYEGSPRLRMTEGGSAQYPNYLVYRDSYLLISEEDSKNYDVAFSEDGRTAYVTPALSAEELAGRTGVIFLADELGNDNVLVFDGAPDISGGTMTAPLKKTEDITINMLFSDGQLAAEEQPARPAKRSFLRSSGEEDFDIEFTLNPDVRGNNWKADIYDFSPKWPSKPGAVVKVFDLLFEMKINLKFSLSYDIQTTGKSKGRETETIAGFNIPLGPFSVSMNYNLQVDFEDETPIRVKGKMKTDFDYGIGTHGATIKEYRTEVTVDDLVVDPGNPQNFNKPVKFYIGSQIEIKGEFLHLHINLKIFSVSFGPVLKIAQESEGGAYITAQHDKDQYTPPPDRIHNNKIHTCAREGEPGCLCLEIKETYKHKIYLLINLYFKKWEPTLAGNDTEYEVATTQYHRSYTYGDSKILKGYCPHLFYKVPVHVWLDAEHTIPAPAGMDVSVSDALQLDSSEEDLIKDVTDENGTATLFLPYKDPEYRYNCTASGVVDDHPLAGSRLSYGIYPDQDPPTIPVNITLNSSETVTIKTNIIWDVDAEKKDVPHESEDGFAIVLFRREAGTENEWEVAIEDEYGLPIEIGQWIDEPDHHWMAEEWTVPKFGFTKDDKAFFYEYRVRIYEEDTRLPVITPENHNCYINRYTGLYETAAGSMDGDSQSRYHVAYDEALKEDADTSEKTLTTDITLTAVRNVEITKKWQLNDPGSRPEEIYLALEQKPETGWEDLAEVQGIPQDWTIMLHPMLDSHPDAVGGTTLKELEDAGILTTEDDIGSIEDMPLTIGKVTPDSKDVWKIMFTVPMYRKGVQMQYQGSELDASAIERLLKNEYDLMTSASVASSGSFLSIPGVARSERFRYHQNADVINLDPPEEGTLVGTVHWQPAYTFPWGVPDTVDIHIYKDGEEIAESPLTLSASDYMENDDRSTLSDFWIWTLKTEGFDPDAVYTVKEVLPDTHTKIWIPEESGLDVFNYNIEPDSSLMLYAEAFFDYEPAEVGSIPVSIKEIETGTAAWETELKKRDEWWDRKPVPADAVMGIQAYAMDAPDIDGYVKTYEDPYPFPMSGQLWYRFAVSYTKQSENLKLHIHKDWTDTDASTAYPEEILVKVYRDSELIAEEKLKKSSRWEDAVVSKDADGNPLKRVSDDGHKYSYSVVEEAVDGFTSDVAVTEDTGGDDITYTLTNQWVGADYVNVKGTITWKDTELKQFRPETVSISVVNSSEEYVESIHVPVTQEEDSYTFEAKYLPGKDKDGNPLTYSVLESHVDGYTIKYKEPEYDEETRTWTCDITNELSGYFPLTIRKTVKGQHKGEDETFEFEIAEAEGSETPEKGSPLPINKDELKIKGEGEVKAQFVFSEDGIYLYSVKEKKGSDENCTYDKSEYLVLIVRATDEERNITFRSWVIEATDADSAEKLIGSEPSQDGQDAAAEPSGEAGEEGLEPIDMPESDVVGFTNYYANLKVEKEWDIDLENKDRPDSIQVLVQKKNGSSWESVRLIELNEENDWKASVPTEGGDGAEYRVRELKEETALQELAENRIVYDKGDSDKSGAANEVTYHVGAYTSVLTGGEEEAHVTKYKVSYDKDGDTHKIKNTAIIEIDEYKRWISAGVDDEDMPDSVWMVLMAKPKAGALDNAGALADAAGIDISSVLSYEFPVIDPMKGGMDPVEVFGEMTLGIDLGFIGDAVEKIFGVSIPKIAMGKADKAGGWKLEFTDKKYNKGIPMEYMGAELSSEVIRQVIKYLAHVDVPASYNPFDNYISIPMKAVKSIEGIENPSDLLDFSKLSGAALEKAKSLTMDDIRNFDWSTMLTDYHLMANVVNIKVDWDSEDEPETLTVEGKKTWKDNDNAEDARPKSITIRLKANGETVKGLAGMDEDGGFMVKPDAQGNWTWRFEGLDKEDKDGYGITYTITEDAVKDYTASIDGYNITNTYTPDKTQVTVTKVWNDGGNADGIRPDVAVIELWKQTAAKDACAAAGGAGEGSATAEPVTDEKGHPVTLTLSTNNNWTASFTGLAKEDGEGHAITYSVKETETDVITGEDTAATYAYEMSGDAVQGFTFTNTHTPENIIISGMKIWDDENDKDGLRPETITVRLMNGGKEIAAMETGKEAGWRYQFAPQPRKDAKGQEITYTITEDPVEGYSASIDGYNITNKHTPAPDIKTYKITYDLNGGVYKGSTEKIVEEYEEGEEITIHEEPERESYTFLYWKGSEYKPGDKYTVTEDHTFTAQWEEIPVIKTYKITYDLNGGVYKGSADKIIEEHEEGEEITIHEEPEREGYNFLYWKGSEYKPGDKYTVTEDHTFTAQWEEIPVVKTYKITYDLNGGVYKGSTDKIVEEYEEGEEITIHEEPEREGYNFLYWKGSEYRPGDKYTVTEDHTFTAQWEEIPVIKTYKITYDLNGGVYKGSADNIVEEYEEGEEITIHEEPEREGYTFLYWKGSEYKPGDIYTVTEDHTFTAQWEEIPVIKTFKITYDLNGGVYKGSTEKIIEEYEEGEEITIHEKPEREGYTFLYWKGSEYKPGDKYTVTEDHTFTAQWEEIPVVKTYKITYDLNGGVYKGSTEKIIEEYEEGEEITIHEKPEREGYTFLYWKGSEYRPSDKYTVTEDHTFTAQWEEIPVIKTYKITYDLNGGVYKGSAEKIVEEYEEGEEITIHEEPEREGYTFLYWKGSEYKPGDKYTVTEDHTFTAQWEEVPVIKTFKITYDLNGGVYKGSAEKIIEEYEDGKEITIHEEPEREGYNFLYWKGSEYKPGDKYTVTEDHTFTAQWEEIPVIKTFKITYDLNGGVYKGSAEKIVEEYEEGEEITIHEEPEREGYNFLYWKGSEYKPGDKYTVTEDHTFTAQWEEIPVDPDNPDIPDDPKDPETPKQPGGNAATGDSADPVLWLVTGLLAAASATAGLLIRLSYRKKRQKK